MKTEEAGTKTAHHSETEIISSLKAGKTTPHWNFSTMPHLTETEAFEKAEELAMTLAREMLSPQTSEQEEGDSDDASTTLYHSDDSESEEIQMSQAVENCIYISDDEDRYRILCSTHH
jgi:hypothetical protein